MGTLRNDRAGSGNEVCQKTLCRSEVCRCQNREDMKLIIWKEKRDVLTIEARIS